MHLLTVAIIALLLPAPPVSDAEAVGGYGNGCLLGGVEIATKGPGFETIRRHRRRYYAHPRLQAFVTRFGQQLLDAGLPTVLVGDTAQDGGGRMPSGHRSHQTGLDADFWFSRPKKHDSDKRFATMVDRATETIAPDAWTDVHPRMLRIAAEDPDVARIFVHWVIKRALCEATSEGERDWLKKVRPWWGHDRHFHVRLRCPPGSADCRNQPDPSGPQCGQESWFSRAAVDTRKAAGKKPRKRKAHGAHPRCAKARKKRRKRSK